MATGISAGLNPTPDRSELQGFGKTMAVAVPLVFGLLIPWVWGRAFSVWPWIVGAAFALAAWALPLALRWPHWLWMRLGAVLHRVNSFLLFSLLFFVVLTPLGWFFRLRGRDPLRRRWDSDRTSYREERSMANLVERMDNQF